MNKLFLLLCLVSVLTGCATAGVNRADQNTLIKEFYASVESVKEVELSSEMKTALVGGAVIGIIENVDGNHEDMIAGGIAGALIGGIFTGLIEGSNIAFEYSLNSLEQGSFTLIQKEKITSQCVKVRMADQVTISQASASQCHMPFG